MVQLKKVFLFLFMVPLCGFLVGDDYCSGIIANALEAYYEGITIAFEFWCNLAVDYC